MKPYLGKDDQRVAPLGTHVVLTLMEPYFGRSYNVTVENWQRNSLKKAHLLLVLCDWTERKYQSLPSGLPTTRRSTAATHWTLSNIRPSKQKLLWFCRHYTKVPHARQQELKSQSQFYMTILETHHPGMWRWHAWFNVQTDVDEGRLPTMATCHLLQHPGHSRHQRMDYI